jgi:hypothetical protein
MEYDYRQEEKVAIVDGRDNNTTPKICISTSKQIYT